MSMNKIITKDNFVLVRNLLTNDELQEFLEYSLKTTSHEICHTSYTAKYLMKSFDFDKVYDIYIKLCQKLDEDKINKMILQKIRNIFDDKNYLKCLYLLYQNDSKGIHSHVDSWSTWNMVISIGESTNLFINDQNNDSECIKINQGDVYLFNGGKVFHSVSPIRGKNNKKNILKLFDETKDFRRYCFQFRKPNRKNKKKCFHLRTTLRRSLRLQNKHINI